MPELGDQHEMKCKMMEKLKN